MKSFKHINAETLHEVYTLLKKNGGKAKVIAGGTDLLGILKGGNLPDYPEALINIKTIPGLDCMKEDVEGLKIGALTTLSDISRFSVIKEKYKVLAEAANTVATPQIRNAATIGGNLCQDVRCWYYRYPQQIGGRILCARKGGRTCPAVRGDNRYHAIIGGKKCFAVCPSDTAIALTALDATMKIAGPNGNRTILVKDFFGTLTNVLTKDEIVTEIQVPKLKGRVVQGFSKFTIRQPIDFAIVSVASIIGIENGICKEARIAIGAVAPTPIRATQAEAFLEGKKIDSKIAAEAAEVALSGAKPMGNNAYKVDIAKTLIRRGVTQQ